MAVDKEIRRLQEEQLERERNSVPRAPLPSEFLSMMTADELKNVIFDLYDQVREMNARLAEKDHALAEKDRMIGTLTEKLDTVIANQKQAGLDRETWLAKQKQWEKEREALLKSIANLRDLIQVMKKHRFKGTSQKRKDGNASDKGKTTTVALTKKSRTLLRTRKVLMEPIPMAR